MHEGVGDSLDRIEALEEPSVGLVADASEVFCVNSFSLDPTNSGEERLVQRFGVRGVSSDRAKGEGAICIIRGGKGIVDQPRIVKSIIELRAFSKDCFQNCGDVHQLDRRYD